MNMTNREYIKKCLDKYDIIDYTVYSEDIVNTYIDILCWYYADDNISDSDMNMEKLLSDSWYMFINGYLYGLKGALCDIDNKVAENLEPDYSQYMYDRYSIVNKVLDMFASFNKTDWADISYTTKTTNRKIRACPPYSHWVVNFIQSFYHKKYGVQLDIIPAILNSEKWDNDNKCFYNHVNGTKLFAIQVYPDIKTHPKYFYGLWDFFDKDIVDKVNTVLSNYSKYNLDITMENKINSILTDYYKGKE